MTEAALGDWIGQLHGHSRPVIAEACEKYLKENPRRRPTPGDIRGLCGGAKSTRSDLSADELFLLEDKILPTAKRWVTQVPGLAEQGQKILDYWGEPL